MVRILCGVLGLVVVVGAASADEVEKPKLTGEYLTHHARVAAALEKHSALAIYEGLPHQEVEWKLLQSELKTKKTVTFHDYPFYAESLPMKKEDFKMVTATFSNSASFRDYRIKLCGEFHPDYCLEWKVGKETWRALVCLGCQDVIFDGPGGLRLLCELNADAYKKLKPVVTAYRKNRPGDPKKLFP
ncbi:MAG: hypothetical protein IAF94_26870 [Pirellulaceae bacterium]|nr:hypothetical protein [Pirellulaceae bacterium]